jgi:outer membrane protein OmpA-like peptidoglycan-associated protein
VEEKIMRYTIAVFSAIALLTATSANADGASRQENIGVGSGAVVGAMAGGPVGFIIGAAIGAKIGDRMHRKDQAIDSLGASLESSRGDVSALQHEIRTLNGDIDTLSAELGRIQEIDRPGLVDLMQAGIAMDLLFRTDEFVLADTTSTRFAELAGTIATMSGLRVQLDGFADERGDPDYNLRLSQQRVDFVREQLIAAGVDAARIVANAHGEVPARDDAADSYALERRVSLKLFIDDSPSFAANPE